MCVCVSKICIEISFKTIISIYPVKSLPLNEGRLSRTPLTFLQVNIFYVLNKVYTYILYFFLSEKSYFYRRYNGRIFMYEVLHISKFHKFESNKWKTPSMRTASW